MNLIKVIIASILITSCATISDPFQGKSNEFKEMLKNNDVASLKEFLKENSFSSRSIPTGSSWAKKQNAYLRLTSAITGHSGRVAIASNEECRTEFVKTIINSGLPPRSKDLVDAALIPCKEMTKFIIKRLDQGSVDKGIKDFSSEIEKHFNRISSNPDKANEYQDMFSLLKTHASRSAAFDLKNSHENFKKIVIIRPKNQARKQQGKRLVLDKIQEKYKIPFCREDNLFNTLYYNQLLLKNCIYALHGPIRIFQNAEGGVLIHKEPGYTHVPDQIFFLQTSKSYVDGQRVWPILVTWSGTYKYKTVLGALKTVHAFKYLEDLDPKLLKR